MDGLWVRDAMLCCLLIQQVEEVLDGERDRTARAQDHREKIVHKLLQRPLTNTVKFTLQHKKVKVSACQKSALV